MKEILNTLYVFTRGAYLKLDGGTVVILIEQQKKHQVPLHHLESIVLFGEINISTPLLQKCAEDGRAVILLSYNGNFKARIEGKVSGNVLLRINQFQANNDLNKTVALAKMFVIGKIQNSRSVLLRTTRDTREKDEVTEIKLITEKLKHKINLLSNNKLITLDEIRGHEGDCAKLYFSIISYNIRYDLRKDFQFNGRTRRPPRDRLNALLSFLYTILLNDCRSAIEVVGLDPQIGFLHTLRPGRAGLALDLCEEFRSFIADRLAFTLINRLQLKYEHFKETESGEFQMTEDGRRIVVNAYQERKQEEITHKSLKSSVQIGLLPYLQARLLARYLRGEIEVYEPYIYN
jgi:CRISP-associated protein Cas1